MKMRLGRKKGNIEVHCIGSDEMSLGRSFCGFFQVLYLSLSLCLTFGWSGQRSYKIYIVLNKRINHMKGDRVQKSQVKDDIMNQLGGEH